MTKPILDVIKNTREILMTDSSLDTLLDFERVLDNLDIYVFKHWKFGELVEGPIYEKYFVSCTFMWPYKLMPDPRGGERLLSYDCSVIYTKDILEHPIKIKDPDDFKPGGKMPKLIKSPIWLVEIAMPKTLMQEIQRGSLEIESSILDLEDIDQAYEEGSDSVEEPNESGDQENDIPNY